MHTCEFKLDIKLTQEMNNSPDPKAPKDEVWFSCNCGEMKKSETIKLRIED